ncbi:extracellular solute-binding protein [Paenibacillus sp. UNCCL117]|uniref:extracellular solute-binding protein n=1 Tax=unclassified Paenibacillus TaxID=185978 RepID=UPI0008861164|nr:MULTISPECIES: extracellular solute-binding protein [unclassified Paenibacillus]SDE45853.1 extracellular solute-binding protein [Paenibacillus sp. cl123]SFW65981.1 extracellular solute-binding protein [Paenibacillus sp. UNCCL117]
MGKLKAGIWLSAAALLSVLSGCDEAPGPAAAIGKEGEAQRAVLKIMKPLFPGHIYYPDSELEKLVEAATGVEAVYETPLFNEYRAKLALRIAGGEIPDIVNTYSPHDPEHNALIDQGVFLALDDLLPEFPKLRQSFSEATWNYMRSRKDGKIYGVPWMRDRGGQGIIIRSDWLERLGLKPPKTLEELTQTLIAFRDRDPDGNGLKDTIPLTFKDHQIWNISSVLTLFGVNPGWHPGNDGGRLEYGWVQPGAKDALKLLRTYRLQGLLDPDLFVGKTLGVDKFLSGKVGVLMMNINDFRQIAVRPDLKAELLDPIVHEGHYWSLLQPATPISRTNQISSQTNDPRAALRYLEYQVTEGYDYIQYGMEGKTYRIQEGVKIPFPQADKDPRYNTNVGLELVQPEWLFRDPEKYTKFVPRPMAEYMMGKLDVYERHILYDYLRPDVALPVYQEKWTQLNQLLEDGLISMLLDARTDPDQAFAALAAKWSRQGGDEVTAEINRLQQDKSQPSYSYMSKP